MRVEQGREVKSSFSEKFSHEEVFHTQPGDQRPNCSGTHCGYFASGRDCFLPVFGPDRHVTIGCRTIRSV